MLPLSERVESNKAAPVGALWKTPAYNDSGWTDCAIPAAFDSDVDGVMWFRRTVDLPAAWAGKSAGELIALTGLKTIRFCHNGRFLVTCDEKEDAVAACRLAQRAGEKKQKG